MRKVLKLVILSGFASFTNNLVHSLAMYGIYTLMRFFDGEVLPPLHFIAFVGVRILWDLLVSNPLNMFSVQTTITRQVPTESMGFGSNLRKASYDN